MVTMSGKNSAPAIRTIIDECIGKAGIPLEKIYCITTDNGANVLKTSRDIMEEIRRELASRLFNGEENMDEIETEQEPMNVDFEDEAILEAYLIMGSNLLSLEKEEADEPAPVEQLIDDAAHLFHSRSSGEELRCGAHVVQLAVNVFLRPSYYPHYKRVGEEGKTAFVPPLLTNK